MKKNKSSRIFLNSLRIFRYLSKKMQKRLIFLLISMLANAFFEFLTIASIVPFLTILSEPDKIFDIPFSQRLFNLLNIQDSDQFMLPFILLFLVIIITSGSIRIFNLWYSCKFSANVGEKITVKAFNNFLHLPYEKHLELNSSEVISIIGTYTDYMVTEIYEYLRIITAFVISIFLIISFLFVDVEIALITMLIFISSYLAMFFMFRKDLNKIEQVIAESNIKQVKLMQESAGSIRDIILDRNQNLISNLFKVENKRYRDAISNLTFLQAGPRIYIEVFALIIVTGISFYIVSFNKSILNPITLIGVIAITGQKLLPLFQQIYVGVLSCNSTQLAVSAVLDFLQTSSNPDDLDESSYTERFSFKEKITLKNIYFKYNNSDKYILEGINSIFYKGERIGIIGKTGSGKSTFIDLIMGLLKPTEGELIVDQVNLSDKNNYNFLEQWRYNISHVPQEVFLINNSFSKNIGLTSLEKEIDLARIKKVADISKISTFIEKQPYSYESIINEKGSNLSGGQKQRIGIARALYKNSDLLFLDEATSALDRNTEKLIVESIKSLSKKLTIFIVTHKKETLKNCDRIFEIKDSKLIELKN